MVDRMIGDAIRPIAAMAGALLLWMALRRSARGERPA
jgi:hypothetical protein